ncbi:CDP-alcohol phosphatidyltransferase family protein [Streptosporangium sp. NPDC000396]|uniref:CDP-alcohol phosphatidyltransferase family protein n=1 Tax=Streptosporangium sp. NPDC000396 TaxID=3366185 RepID=UPI003676C8EB
MHDSRASATSGASQTAAVVLATTAAATLRCPEGTLLDRLTGQLHALPVGDVHVVARSSDVIHAPGGTYMIGSEGSRGLADDLRRVAKVARASSGPVAVVAGDLVAHTEALAMLLKHPARDTGALVATDGDEPGPLHPPVRVEGGLVVAAGGSADEVPGANGTFRGAFQVGLSDLVSLAKTADALAERSETGGFGPTDGAEVGELLLAGLIGSGVQVRASGLGRLHCDRVAEQESADSAVTRLGEVDEANARLDAAVKTNDGFFTTYFVSSWSTHVVKLAARLGLTPNAVTGISVGLAALAALWFSAGVRPALIVGAVLLYLSFVLDCVDGQLARYTRAFSPMGAWLDATFDRVKEYVVYVGLAFGYAAQPGESGGDPDGIWTLAVAAMIMQAIRHMIDFSYAGSRADAAGANRAGVTFADRADVTRADVTRADAARTDVTPAGWTEAIPADWADVTPEDWADMTSAGRADVTRAGAAVPDTPADLAAVPDAPADEVVPPPTPPERRAGTEAGIAAAERYLRDRRRPGTGLAGMIIRMSRHLERHSVTRWFKKMIVLPIGERMALIAVTAALFDARVTFVALLAWGGVAALYTLVGRIGRSLSQ